MIQKAIIEKSAIDAKTLNMFCEHIYKSFGIYIEEGKRHLLATKISTLMRNANIDDAAQYYHFIASPPISELQKEIKNKFIDTVTVHKTNFFRENNHFNYIKRSIKDILANSNNVKYSKEIRVWSAATSTGDEAYTLAMVFKEILPPDIKVKILATDISPQSLKTALGGVYKLGPEDYIPPDILRKYFTPVGPNHQVNEDIKSMVTFRLFNLIEPFPFKNPFDIIFCRNVMIYFDNEVQGRLVNKFYDALSDNGLLFIGHSESLIQMKHRFVYTEPTIYKKM